jgi:hypothetical protein
MLAPESEFCARISREAAGPIARLQHFPNGGVGSAGRPDADGADANAAARPHAARDDDDRPTHNDATDPAADAGWSTGEARTAIIGHARDLRYRAGAIDSDGRHGLGAYGGDRERRAGDDG